MRSVVGEKSFQFAVRIVKMCKYLRKTKGEFTLSRQLLRSGTSIGANVAEVLQAQSRPDFAAKLGIALKETAETKYWLRLMSATDYIPSDGFNSIFEDCCEIEKILVSILKTLRN